jgi:hypothetical protein
VRRGPILERQEPAKKIDPPKSARRFRTSSACHELLRPITLGAAAGAVAVLVIGFYLGRLGNRAEPQKTWRKKKSAQPLYWHYLPFALTNFKTAPMRQQTSWN